MPGLATTPAPSRMPIRLKGLSIQLLSLRLAPVALLALVARDELGDRRHVAHRDDVLPALGTVAVGVLDTVGLHRPSPLDEFGEFVGRHHPSLHDAVAHTSG